MKFFFKPTVIKVLALLIGLFLTYPSYLYLVVDPGMCPECPPSASQGFGRIFFDSFSYLNWINLIVDFAVLYLAICLVSWIFHLIIKRLKK